MDRKFRILPEVGSLTGFLTFGVAVVRGVHGVALVRAWACGVKTCGGVEHVVMIDRKGHHRHGNVFVNEISLGGGICRLSIDEFRTADDRIFGNLLCGCNCLRTLGGEGTVKGTLDFATFLGSGWMDG